MHRPREQKAEDQKKKPDDKGYNSSLARCPIENMTHGKISANFQATQ
jgi:hypothetical protein